MYKFFKYFSFNAAERNGFIVLLMAIAIINLCTLAYNLLLPDKSMTYELVNLATNDEITERNLTLAHHDIISDRPAAYAPSEINYFFFDPNSITATEWKKLGLSDKQSKVILNYLAKGGKFYKKEDLKKIYSITEKDYARLEPYITIKEHSTNIAVSNPKAENFAQSTEKRSAARININLADTVAFKSLRGIGSVLASRIVKFRDALGGFHSVEQIKEVYGLSEETFSSIVAHLAMEQHQIKKLQINKLGVTELVQHPYINRKQAQLIVNYRDEHGPYSDMSHLSKNKGLDPDFLRKIEPYLEF